MITGKREKEKDGRVMHKVYIKGNYRHKLCGVCGRLIKQAVDQALESEAVDSLCTVNILITDDKGIREYNRKYRKTDKTTDVLSFPMQVFLQPGWSGLNTAEPDMNTGDLPLGDIIISTESVKRQAEEYGNTIKHEIVYLTIHSTLHLLGYDHQSKQTEILMHTKNRSIMRKMGFKI